MAVIDDTTLDLALKIIRREFDRVDGIIANANSFDIIVCDTNTASTVPNVVTGGTLTPSASTTQKMYLVSDRNSGGDKYDEYITVRNGNSYLWERLGSINNVNLSNYYNKTQIDSVMYTKADQADIDALSAMIGATHYISNYEGPNPNPNSSNSYAADSQTFTYGVYYHQVGTTTIATLTDIYADVGTATFTGEIKDTYYQTHDSNRYLYKPYTIPSTSTADWRVTDIFSEIANLLVSKADLTSPKFKGTPQAPTAAVGTNTNEIATTAFVKNAIDNIPATDISGKADKNNTVLTGSLSLSRVAGSSIGIESSAVGGSVIASGNYSHAEGYNTVANSNSSHVSGKWNIPDNDVNLPEWQSGVTYATGQCINVAGSDPAECYVCTQGHTSSGNAFPGPDFNKWHVISSLSGSYAEIIGNGTSIYARSNARTLDWSGNETLSGKLTVGAGPVNTMDVATKGYVDGLVISLAAAQNMLGRYFNDVVPAEPADPSDPTPVDPTPDPGGDDGIRDDD